MPALRGRTGGRALPADMWFSTNRTVESDCSAQPCRESRGFRGFLTFSTVLSGACSKSADEKPGLWTHTCGLGGVRYNSVSFRRVGRNGSITYANLRTSG